MMLLRMMLQIKQIMQPDYACKIAGQSEFHLETHAHALRVARRCLMLDIHAMAYLNWPRSKIAFSKSPLPLTSAGALRCW